MLRLASLLNFLAFMVGLTGVVCVYLMYRPGTLGGALAATRDFAALAFADPLVLASAAVAVVTTVFVRVLDRPRPVEPSRRVHRLDEDLELGLETHLDHGPGVEDAGAVAPVRVAAPDGPRREAEHLRRRLEALLRGRTDVVAVVDELLAGALRCNASDVHLQPREGFARLALRLEGEIVDLATVAESQHVKIVRRLKVLAHLVSYKTDEPQDGRFSLATPSASVDVRVAVLPTHHGEKVALRLLRPGAGLLAMEKLGMDDATRSAFRGLLEEPQGLLVLTGPTGSGKTTTLYSALDHIHRSRGDLVQLATIEDPVEIDLPFVSQTQVDRARGLDFAAGLRALLRQDPNVLMVGEVRDRETAKIAVQAGLTGQLVLTSLHAESSAGVFARLIDMEIEPFLVASSTLACVSQRLVRLLCDGCRRPVRVERAVVSRLAQRGVALDTGFTFFEGEGCRACERTGVRGRTAVFEMLRMTPELRRRIASKVPTAEIEEAAVAGGMKPLFKMAVEMAAAGRISLDEALRVAG